MFTQVIPQANQRLFYSRTGFSFVDHRMLIFCIVLTFQAQMLNSSFMYSLRLLYCHKHIKFLVLHLIDPLRKIFSQSQSFAGVTCSNTKEIYICGQLWQLTCYFPAAKSKEKTTQSFLLKTVKVPTFFKVYMALNTIQYSICSKIDSMCWTSASFQCSQLILATFALLA